MAEHVYFLFSKCVISRKNSNYSKSRRVPFLPLCFSHTPPQRCLSVSHSGDLGTLLIHLFCWDSFILCVSLTRRSPLRFYFSIHPLSRSDLLLSKKFKYFLRGAHQGQMWFAKKKKKNWRVCFTFRLENSVIAREVLSHDKCSINPSWALQGFKMIRGEFLLSTFGFFFFLICSFFSFYFLVLSFVLILSRVLFHCVSSTTGN